MLKPINVYVGHNPDLSQGIHRVSRALRAFTPNWVQIVDQEDWADLRIGHVVGIQDMEEWCSRGPYALIQYCVQTGGGTAEEWRKIWMGAKTTWSYYDLAHWLSHTLPPSYSESLCPNFYYAPLGVDPVFKPSFPLRKRYMIGTSGYVDETECIGECYRAATRVERSMLHLGPHLNFGPSVTCIRGVPDKMLADFWSQCSYVAGLRRIEGFELPVIEGLMCGARPVVFDAPHYRKWFDGFAEFIPEGTPQEVEDALFTLFSRPVRPITQAEREAARTQFHWPTLCAGFWEAIRCSL